MTYQKTKRNPILFLRPRWLAHFIAEVRGFFWLPCPLCGRYLAGFEWRDINGHMSSIPASGEGAASGICPQCTAEARGCKAWSETPGMWMEHECTYSPHPYSNIFRIVDND